MIKIILASSSPRRIEMMKKHGYDPIIIPADVNEELPFSISPRSAVMYLALKKALCVSDKAIQKNIGSNLVIAADTIVVFNNKIIGKPSDKTEAFKTLSALRNKCHHVITGVCILDSENSLKTCFYDDTEVFFKNFSDDFLQKYVETPEPYDKAGGYAIQGTFKACVRKIKGDLNNVIGFPWYRIEPYIKS